MAPILTACQFNLKYEYRPGHLGIGPARQASGTEGGEGKIGCFGAQNFPLPTPFRTPGKKAGYVGDL